MQVWCKWRKRDLLSYFQNQQSTCLEQVNSGVYTCTFRDVLWGNKTVFVTGTSDWPSAVVYSFRGSLRCARCHGSKSCSHVAAVTSAVGDQVHALDVDDETISDVSRVEQLLQIYLGEEGKLRVGSISKVLGQLHHVIGAQLSLHFSELVSRQ
jgi:hypothetical protein